MEVQDQFKPDEVELLQVPPAEVADIDDNRNNIRGLVDQVKKPIGVVPFVGAGLSMPFCFPGWSGFLLTQAKRARKKTKIQRRLNAGEYEEAAEELLGALAPRAFHDAIENTFGKHKLTGKKPREAVSFLPQLTDGPVVTTNFDYVLEWVFDQANKPFKRVVCGAKPKLAAQALKGDERFLLKIHGEAEESTDRILLREDYEKHYGSADSSNIDLNLPLPRLLYQMLLGRHLLFIGCSLNRDRTMAVLSKVARSFPEATVNYAIVEEPKSRQQFSKRSKYLSERNIRPIWYPPGRHDLIKPLLVHLVTKSKDGDHMFLEIKARGLEIYLTGENQEWGKNSRLRYSETREGYRLFGFRKSQIGKQFKHFVVCDRNDKENIKCILEKKSYVVSQRGSADDKLGRWRVWFLRRDFPTTNGYEDPLSNNKWEI